MQFQPSLESTISSHLLVLFSVRINYFLLLKDVRSMLSFVGVCFYVITRRFKSKNEAKAMIDVLGA